MLAPSRLVYYKLSYKLNLNWRKVAVRGHKALWLYRRRCVNFSHENKFSPHKIYKARGGLKIGAPACGRVARNGCPAMRQNTVSRQHSLSRTSPFCYGLSLSCRLRPRHWASPLCRLSLRDAGCADKKNAAEQRVAGGNYKRQRPPSVLGAWVGRVGLQLGKKFPKSDLPFINLDSLYNLFGF